jgi:hypothetical protein
MTEFNPLARRYWAPRRQLFPSLAFPPPLPRVPCFFVPLSVGVKKADQGHTIERPLYPEVGI